MLKNYQELCITPSDINVHLPVLKEYAAQCSHVTEFGVRDCVSTYAFIEANPVALRCYDYCQHENMVDAQNYAASTHGIDIAFVIASTLEAEIEPTDFLFIDTKHNYLQLNAELLRHADKAKKFIGFHDVVTFGLKNEFEEAGKQGLTPAIFEFLQRDRNWQVDYYSYECNGLLILKRV